MEEIDAEKLKAQQEQERLQREVTYTIADGSPIYNPDAYSRTNIRHGRTFAMPGSGRTISMKDAVTDKEINDLLRLHQFAWLSNGKDSCWLRMNVVYNDN